MKFAILLIFAFNLFYTARLILNRNNPILWDDGEYLYISGFIRNRKILISDILIVEKIGFATRIGTKESGLMLPRIIDQNDAINYLNELLKNHNTINAGKTSNQSLKGRM